MVRILESRDVLKVDRVNFTKIASLKHQIRAFSHYGICFSEFRDWVEEVAYDIAMIHDIEFSPCEYGSIQSGLFARDVQGTPYETGLDRIEFEPIGRKAQSASFVQEVACSRSNFKEVANFCK
jgi:hypothetical protein